MPTPGAAPSPDISRETALRSKDALVAAGPSHEKAAKVKAKVEEGRAAGQGAMESLDSALSTQAEKIDPAEATKIVKEKYGNDPQLARSTSLAFKLIDGGYAGLNTAAFAVDVPSDRAEVRAFVESVIYTDPQLGAIFNAFAPITNAAAREAAMQDLIDKNPGLLAAVKKRYLEWQSESAALTDEVAPARAEAQRLGVEEKDLRKQQADKKQALETAKAHKQSFDNKTGEPYDTLKRLTDNLEPMRVDLETRQSEKTFLMGEQARINGDIQRLTGRTLNPRDAESLRLLRANLVNISGQKLRTQTRLTELENQIRLQQDLQAESDGGAAETITRLKSELGTLNPQVGEVTIRRKAAEAALATKKASPGGALAERGKRIIQDGVGDYLKAEMQTAETTSQEMYQAEIDAATDAGTKAVAEQKKNRWTGADGKTDKDLVNPDWGVYLDKTRGPKEVLGHMLGAQFIKDKGYNPLALTPTQATEVNNYVSEKLANQAFVDSQIPGAVQALIAARLRSGAKLTEAEGNYIMENPATVGAIDAAVASNKVLKDRIDKLKKDGVIPKTFVEFLKEKKGPVLIAWLVFIFGTFGAGALVVNHIK